MLIILTLLTIALI